MFVIQFLTMKIAEKIPYIFIAGFIYLLIYSSCANQGMPTGGPKDSLPPVLLRMEPKLGELNFKGEEIKLTFNEYIVSDKVADLLVVSPPLQKRPSLKMKSKTLILGFNEELRDSVTYSFDFKNSIEDNNEKNPYKNLRLSFSTGDVFDTLRVAGKVKKAENLNPGEKCLVMLHKNLHDTAIFKLVPDYVAKTDENGLFLFDNLAPGAYHLFAINDANSDMKYNEGVEEIAFADSLIIPEARFYEELDTISRGADSLLISGYVHYLPEPVYLLHFTEDLFSQFLATSARQAKNKCVFVFEEPVSDTFGIKLLNAQSENWYLPEPNPNMDSIVIWVTDTLVSNLDTIRMEVVYNMLDSTGSKYLQKDTLDMYFFEEKREPERRKRRDNDEEAVPEIPQFSFSDNLKTTGFDLNSTIWLTSPEPIKSFNPGQVQLYQGADSTAIPIGFKFEKDTSSLRFYRIDYKWEPNMEYRLEIDSAASTNIFGITNRRLVKKFKTQKEDFYGSIIADLKNVDGAVIIQLLKADEKEELVQVKNTDKNGLVVFKYLAPGKYYLKAIYDANANGEWDNGSFRARLQPEKVAYFQMVIKVRSNWEQKEIWDLAIDPEYPKVLFDADAEAEKKKGEGEKVRENQGQQQENNVFTSPRTLGRN